MAKARARTAARKVKDKWKTKQWYQLLAPAMFNKTVIAETLADDPNKLLHRVSSTTLQDLTGDFKLMHVKLEFQVTEVTGTQGSSVFVGHTLTSDYVRRLIRRNHSKISCVFDVTTKDGAGIRVKPFAVTDRRSQSSQQTAIRNAIGKTLVEDAAGKTMAAFVQEMLNGNLANKVYKVCKPIYPLRKIEINKSEVFQQPTIVMEEPGAAVAPPATTTAAADAGAPEGGSEEPAEEESEEEREEEPATAAPEA
ncbi:MAG: 30S ribosomal protein S3ae [Euryarchaeota archaeon]|nr:30S ribosomal protein S3ae [Euryarchaeota archaeon]